MVCCPGDSLIGIALGVGINIVFHSTSVELLQLILLLLPLLNYFRQPALVRHQLRHGQSEQVISQLALAVEFRQFPTSVLNTLSNVRDYLQVHRDHINYEQFKAMGLPLGSGMVESACKWLIQQRFKGVGMRWSEDGFNHLLHLRLAWVNGRFDQFFSPQASPNR